MAPRPRFTIGSVASINREDWVVVKYHRIFGKWEIMFRNAKTSEHTSIPLRIVESHAK